MTTRMTVCLAFLFAFVGLIISSCDKNKQEVQELRQDQKVQEPTETYGEPSEMSQEQMRQEQMRQEQMRQEQMEQQRMQQERMQQGQMGQGHMGRGMMGQMGEGCPMVVRNAEVGMEETEDGIALEFTTKDGDVDELRQRVRQMAQMYEKHEGRYHMMWRRMGAQGQGGMMEGKEPMAEAGRMPAVETMVEDTNEGARVVIIPKNRNDLDTLRQHIKGHQQRLQSGQCFMLQEEGQGQKQQQQQQQQRRY